MQRTLKYCLRENLGTLTNNFKDYFAMSRQYAMQQTKFHRTSQILVGIPYDENMQ